MKMVILFSLLFGSLLPNPVDNTTTRKVDVNTSVVAWTGYKVTGKHFGKVRIQSGEIAMTDGVITGGTFVIDMNSITCEDLTGDTNGKLIGHLKSDDFFGVDQHPTATLAITRAIPQDSQGNYKILANLTIKGNTKPIKFFAQHSKENGRDMAKAKIKVDRSEYNVRYGSGSFFDNLGDKTIYDEFDMDVTLVLN
jgi:polyisoprenoid-binding protein YceI